MSTTKTSATKNSEKDYADLETHMQVLAEMRASGRPIETAEEYRTWVRCGQDYAAVEKLRADKSASRHAKAIAKQAAVI